MEDQVRYKERYDKGHTPNVFFSVDDIFVMKDVPSQTGESTKLQKSFRGPLVISKVLPDDTYGVVDLRLDSRGHRYASTANANQLKIWLPLTMDDQEDETEITSEEDERKTLNDESPVKDFNEDIPNETESIKISSRLGNKPLRRNSRSR